MIVRATGLQMAVSRFSRQLREVGVLAMPDAGLDAIRGVDSVCKGPPDSSALRLLIPGLAVGVCIDGCSVVDGVEVTR